MKKISQADLTDAFQVLKDYIFYVSGWRTSNLDRHFDNAVHSGIYKQIEISSVMTHHDHGRRITTTRLNNPIIVLVNPSYPGGSNYEYIVLDGQHRLYTLRDAGKKKMNAFVLKMPFRRVPAGIRHGHKVFTTYLDPI